MSQDSSTPPLTGPARTFVLGITSVGGLGYAPKAPGTFGSLGAMPFWWLMAGLAPLPYVIITIGVTMIAIWASNHAERIYEEHDSGRIVVDEFAGILATGFLLPQTLESALAVFVVFRLFDILKPPPIRQIDRSLGGGAGVVLDDVVAGIMACITLHLAGWLFGVL